jgi:tRNA pseudouridine38-40 synthase
MDCRWRIGEPAAPRRAAACLLPDEVPSSRGTSIVDVVVCRPLMNQPDNKRYRTGTAMAGMHGGPWPINEAPSQLHLQATKFRVFVTCARDPNFNSLTTRKLMETRRRVIQKIVPSLFHQRTNSRRIVLPGSYHCSRFLSAEFPIAESTSISRGFCSFTPSQADFLSIEASQTASSPFSKRNTIFSCKMSTEAEANTKPLVDGTTVESGESSSQNKRSLEDSTTTGSDGVGKKADGDVPSDELSAKKPKLNNKEAAENHTRRPRGFDEGRDDRNIPKHEGSYAHENQRKLFGMTDLDENRVEHSEDTKTNKRKIALFLGFLGTKYTGFQVNVGQRTIQGEIELALYRAGLMTPLNFGNPHKYSWSSSARTDKGVHACAQLCSLKAELLESDIEDALKAARERLQERLPPEIQVLDMIRTTRNFCAKTQRDRVRYQYMIPSFLIHPDYRKLLQDHGISLDGREETAKTPLLEEEVKKLQASLNDYRSTEEQRKVLQSALEKYQGTRPFHNFTKGLKPGEPQAKRFIETFSVQDPVVMGGMEWIPTQVLGQSFLLHQIRKMVSLAVDVTRGAATLELMDKALAKREVVCVGIAPAQGLFLEMSYFGGYNRRKGTQNPELPDLDFLQDGPARDRWEACRTKIREHIVEEEVTQGNFLQYLYQQECIFDHKNLYSLDDNAKETEAV